MVLIVESNEQLREFLAKSLVNSGFKVATACTRHQAQSLLDSAEVQFMLICWRLPDETARPFLEDLLFSRPALKFLIISGGRPILPADWPFLAKPFRIQTLIQLMLEIHPALRAPQLIKINANPLLAAGSEANSVNRSSQKVPVPSAITIRWLG